MIVCNTTLSRKYQSKKDKDEKGGLSGSPLFEQSTNVIRILKSELNPNIPIIASGGITSPCKPKKNKIWCFFNSIYSDLSIRYPRLINDSIMKISKI